MARTLNRIKSRLAELPVLFQIAALLGDMGISGYLIGGTIRDLVLDRPIKDIDLAITASPERFLKRLSGKVPGHSVCLDREFLTFRFMTKDQHWFDVTPLKGETIIQDLHRRDFTVNAMAIDLQNIAAPDSPLHLIDPLGGINDLAQRTIRAVSEEAFRDDPLRILRAFRQAGQLGWRIEEKTGNLIRRDRDLLKKPAPERIREELFLILSMDHAGPTFSRLHQSGILPILFSPVLPECPERQEAPEGKALAEGKHGWADALRNLASVEAILSCLPIGDPACLREIHSLLSRTCGHQATYWPLLKLSAFLSAMLQGWPAKNHDRLDSFLRWLCLSTPQRKYVLGCIQGLEKPLELISSQCCTPRYFLRFFRQFGEAGLGALILSIARQRADNVSPDLIRDMDDLLSRMASFYCTWQQMKSHPLVDGNFLLDYFHLSPGPVIGDILNFLEEARAEGEIQTREEAIELARQFFN